MIHDLKSRPDEFAALWRGKASSIVRRVASGIGPGSVVRLREYDVNFGYSGRCIKGLVKCRLESAGLRDGWAMLALRIVHKHSADRAMQRA